MLGERRGVAGAARLVLPPGRTGEAAILVGLALRHLKIACRAELIRTLLDALFGMAYAIGKLAAVRNPLGPRHAGERVVLVQPFDPKVYRAG